MALALSCAVLGLWAGYGCPNPARAWWRSVQAKRETR